MELLIESTTRLDLIKEQLKSEFIGLSEIIDQFIDAVTPWCLMGGSQNRPLVVNLWGMTGVGKTSLVNRFLELWDKDESVILFNMGSSSYFNDLLNSMESMHALDGKTSVIIFDEFQHAKTMDGPMKPAENPLDRMIWQLLDDGKFLFTTSWREINDLEELIFCLELCLERGVKVEKGKVVQAWDFYQEIMESQDFRSSRFSDPNANYFLSERHLEMIFDLIRPTFKYKAMLKDFILQLNEEEILNFLKKVVKNASTTKMMDFSKSLIFVIGNLDDAYDMSGDFSADQDPDILHEESKKITFSKIKEALKDLFRMEEISRLGNIHLIYPAFNSQFFRDFINKELEVIGKRYETAFDCRLEFSPSVKSMLFEEGVTASQGFRPLRSSIRFLIESSLSTLFQSACYEFGGIIRVEMEEDELILRFQDQVIAGKKLHLPIRQAKKQKREPQTMAITAVHEAGHALVYSILFGRLPKQVTITSSDHYNGGFIEGEKISNFDTYDLIIRHIAVKLAGKKAEELVFGVDEITSGSSNDARTATRVLLIAARSGTLPGCDIAYESEMHGFGNALIETDSEVKWVKLSLEKGGKLAEKLLDSNREIFKTFIQILLEKKFLSSESLAEALKSRGVNLNQLLTSYSPILDFKLKLDAFLIEEN